MRGQGKPVFGYYDARPFYERDETPSAYIERVGAHAGLASDDARVDPDGLAIDDFAMSDNLMMIGALESGAGALAGDFETAILQVAETLLGRWVSGETQPYAG